MEEELAQDLEKKKDSSRRDACDATFLLSLYGTWRKEQHDCHIQEDHLKQGYFKVTGCWCFF